MVKIRWRHTVTWVATALSLGLSMYPNCEISLTQLPVSQTQAQGFSIPHHDPVTGFSFAEYTLSWALKTDSTPYPWVTYRVAVPKTTNGSSYDMVLQAVAPKNVAWIGFSWGGHMDDSPLVVAWWYNNNVKLHGRWEE